MENLARCRDALDEFAPDVMVVWGDDQYENFREEVIPPFCVLAYGDVEVDPFEVMTNRGSPNAWGLPDDTTMTLHGDADGARGLADQLLERGFDVAYSYQKRTNAPFPHAIGNTQLFLDYPTRRASVPVSNDPDHRQLLRPARDRAARRAGAVRRDRQGATGSGRPRPRAVLCAGSGRGTVIRRHRPSRRLVASSSWSHAFLTDKTWHITPDTEADQRLYDLFAAGDYAKWKATTTAEIVDSGQHEMLNWFCLAGAVDQLGLDLEWSELVTTDVFNSNKCFAVFTEGSQR